MVKIESFCSLKEKEIINVRDGFRFGFLCDIEFEICSGQICALIVPHYGKLFLCFGRDKEYRIPWSTVKKIGEDIILVDVCPEEILRDC